MKRIKQRDSTGGVPGEADISVTSFKRQATSAKRQAPRPALILPQLNDNRIIKEKDYENK
jgi:hypothetical protein